MSAAARIVERAVIYSVASVFCSMVLVRTALRFVCHPRTFLQVKRRTTPPIGLATALDKCGGSLHTADKMGLKLSYVSAGDSNKPLMLFVHGFPEFWYSWRYQLEHFSRNYRVVAVDMRGYNLSSRPPRIEDYAMSSLIDDLHFLVRNHLGREKCILVAHDWGGVISWRFARRYPDLIERLVIINCPESSAYMSHVSKSLGQFLKSWYIFFFQIPRLPEWFLRTEDFRFFNGIFRKCARVTQEDLECFKYVFSQPDALRGPVNYYRAMLQSPRFSNRDSPSPSKYSAASATPSPPSSVEANRVRAMLLWGTDDLALDSALAEGTVGAVRKWCQCDLKLFHGGNHFLQQDRPDEVNAAIDAFLALRS